VERPGRPGIAEATRHARVASFGGGTRRTGAERSEPASRREAADPGARVVRSQAGASSARNSIGITLVSGMIIGSAFTLFVVPAIYTLVARVHKPAEAPEVAKAGAAGMDPQAVPA
jgi:hypothetical protein